MKIIKRSKWSLIRPNCVRKFYWLDPSASEEVMIRPNCARIRLWSDRCALKEVMIRPNCARVRLWSDPSGLEIAYFQTFQTKLTSDQTISRPWSRLFRPKWPLIRLSADHRLDCSALELPSTPCNFGLGTHRCALDWVWS